MMTSTSPHAPTHRIRCATFLLLLAIAVAGRAASVSGSNHDLSTAGIPGSDEVCVFCHTAHFANTNVAAPLWNRFVDTSKVFTLYSSATLDTAPQAPNFTVSMVCLGCHDGTLGYAVIAGISGSDKHDLRNAGGSGGIPDTTSWPNCNACHTWLGGGASGSLTPSAIMGLNLADEHPINMTYPAPSVDPRFNVPADPQTGWTDVKLYAGKVQCPSCHDPHDPSNAPFLRMTNDGSQLCITCHKR